MGMVHEILGSVRRIWRTVNTRHSEGEPQMIVRGWDEYARTWNPTEFKVLPGSHVEHLGDEWAVEDPGDVTTAYGLNPEVISRFQNLIAEQLLDRYLHREAREGLEIGPGGGRLTALLIPRTKVLHLAEPSEAMLSHLRKRFQGVDSLRMYRTDGMTLPALQPTSLDYVVSFDVFVHFEPRLIFWYLRQIEPLLMPGGVGVIHYSTVLSPIGWRQFEIDLGQNVRQRTRFAAFGVMCPQLMEKFLNVLDLEVVSPDIGLIPRDAIAVFRKPA